VSDHVPITVAQLSHALHAPAKMPAFVIGNPGEVLGAGGREGGREGGTHTAGDRHTTATHQTICNLAEQLNNPCRVNDGMRYAANS